VCGSLGVRTSQAACHREHERWGVLRRWASQLTLAQSRIHSRRQTLSATLGSCYSAERTSWEGSTSYSARLGRVSAPPCCSRGEPGVGKTTLLNEADRRAVVDGMTVLRVHGVESEAELAFAGLSTVLAPILHLVRVLPPFQANALEGALALGTAPAHPLAVGAATLGIIAAASERRAVLVVADDVQWLDEPSAGALLFAARRLNADPAAFLLAARTGEPSPFDGAGIEEKLLTGLDRVTACKLLETAGPTVVPAVADRLHALTGGNPLALIHVATRLDDEQRLGHNPLDEPLPIGLELQRALHRQVVRLPEATRQGLTVVAAEPTGDLAVIEAALSTIGWEIADLDAAADFIDMDRGRIEFRHPLVRAACYHEAPPTHRRRAHAALAQACASVGADPGREQQAWHLAAAAAGPDEQAARLLDEVSEVTSRRGALTTAGRGFERAARLSPDLADRCRRLQRAAEAFWLRGYLDQAVPLLDEIMATTHDPIVRADAASLRGQAETWRAGPRRSQSMLTAEAEAVEGHDPNRAAGLLAHAVTAVMLEGDIKRAVQLARRAVDVAGKPTSRPGAGSLVGSLALAHTLLLHGQADEATRLLEPLQQLADALAGSVGVPDAEHLVQAMALLDLMLEEWERGRRRVATVIERARRLGTPGVLAFSSAVLAEIYWRTGRWTEAYAVASSDVQAAWGGEDPAARAFALGYLARIEAGLGNVEACRRTANEALTAGTRLGMGSAQLFANSALGFLELGLGDAEAALVHLDQVTRAADAWELRNPGIVWWAGDHLEACWRAGRIDETRRRVDGLEEVAEATHLMWARGIAARTRGLLAGEASFEEEFAASLTWLERVESPFERARTRLCRGERRHRVGRHADGDLDLQDAMSVFERLGARLWAERARSLLGRHVATPTRPALSLLTPSELRVALAVGHGSSNRAAADDLYISVKTVDFHLQNIYRKLEPRSRTELAVLVARDGVAS